MANLEIFRLCAIRGRGLLSWVPNLSISCQTNPLPNCAASGASRLEFHTPLDISLTTRGVCTSSIRYFGDRVLQTAKLPEIKALC